MSVEAVEEATEAWQKIVYVSCTAIQEDNDFSLGKNAALTCDS